MEFLASLKSLLGDRPQFMFEIRDAHEFRVIEFVGREALSTPYEFVLKIAGPAIDPSEIIDRDATLKIDGIVTARFVSGILSDVIYLGDTPSYQIYEVTLVPWIARLEHRQNSRIFQDETTPQILKRVLIDAGLLSTQLRLALVNTYECRNYCVQYQETDLNFISRLMEEDGMFYFFEHDAGGHVLVISDDVGNHPSIPGGPELYFVRSAGEMVVHAEHIYDVRVREQLRPGRVSLRDYNLHRPYEEMDAAATDRRRDELEIYVHPGGYQSAGRGGSHEGGVLARLRLQASSGDRRVVSGTSNCVRLTAGHMLTMLGHPRHELDRSYRIISVTHTGRQPQALDEHASGDGGYRNECTLTDLEQPWRSRQRTPQPRVLGLQTATVVGPVGEDVHTDEHGRVKVQFHWDRTDAHDDTSSCWVRVSQAWAGAGWGALFLPRIGNEVLVDFIDGDPDRPMVTGSIYHGTNQPPYPLPLEKTKSTIKSASSPGSGFNELRFEDAKGREEVFIHAQKDLNEVVLCDNSRSVGANQSFSVDGNQSFTITKNRSVTVTEGDESLTVTTGSSCTRVKQDRSVTVESGESSLTVEAGAHTVIVAQTIAHTSKAADVAITAEEAMSLRAKNSTLLAVAKQSVTVKSTDSTLRMSGKANVSLQSKTSRLDVRAKGQITVKSESHVLITAPDAVLVRSDALVSVKAKDVKVEGDALLELVVGDSVVRLTPDGVSVKALKIDSASDQVHTIKGSIIRLN